MAMNFLKLLWNLSTPRSMMYHRWALTNQWKTITMSNICWFLRIISMADEYLIVWGNRQGFSMGGVVILPRKITFWKIFTHSYLVIRNMKEIVSSETSMLCFRKMHQRGYSTLSWVRMCGPKFRQPSYNLTKENSNLQPMSKPFAFWRALFKTNQYLLLCKLGCINTFLTT